MECPEDPREQKRWMLDVLVDLYGSRTSVLKPENHPNVYAYEHALEDPKDRFKKPLGKKLTPQYLRHWTWFDKTRRLLRNRYGVFQHPDLLIDCPVHWYYGRPERKEDLHWFHDCFRMDLRKDGQMRFSCRARRCQWVACSLNLKNPKGERLFDIYDLIQHLESLAVRHRIDLEEARRIVSGEFGVEVAHFDSGTGTGLGRFIGRRRVLDKTELLELLGKDHFQTRGDVEVFISEAVSLIHRSSWMEYYQRSPKIFRDRVFLSPDVSWWETLRDVSPACKLFLYWHLEQQEAGRPVEINSREYGRVCNYSSRQRCSEHVKLLKEKGYLKLDKKGRWTILYRP